MPDLTSKTKKFQAPSESLPYTLKMSTWVSSISGTPTVLKVTDVEDVDTDLSASVIGTQAVSVSGTDITLPHLKSLTLVKSYRVHVNFSTGSDTYEPNFIVECRY